MRRYGLQRRRNTRCAIFVRCDGSARQHRLPEVRGRYASLPRRKKLTQKEHVLRRYPDAFSKQGFMSGDWYVWSQPDGHIVGKAATLKDAWQDAALFVGNYGG